MIDGYKLDIQLARLGFGQAEAGQLDVFRQGMLADGCGRAGNLDGRLLGGSFGSGFGTARKRKEDNR
jgi:hypothetical protein